MAEATISVVVATRTRPRTLRRTIASILAQEDVGPIEVIVVRDHPHLGIDSIGGALGDELATIDPGPHSISVIPNRRTPGLSGARNSGILEARGSAIAFCGADEWKPGKLRDQLALLAHPDVALCATGIEIRSEEGMQAQPAPQATSLTDLLRSRTTGLNSASFLTRADTVKHQIGPFDEWIPTAGLEDYDFLLRAAKIGSIVAVPRTLTIVHDEQADRPGESEASQDLARGLDYLCEKHPEIRREAAAS